MNAEVKIGSDWISFGQHRLRIEGDVVVSVNVGPMSLDEVRGMMECIEVACRDDGVRYYLMDLTRAEAPSPAARKWMSQHRHEGIVATVGFGAPRALRVMTDLMRRAMDLIQPNRPQSTFRLFADESEARTFIAESRQSRAREQSGAS